ncbi:MAG: dTMP kinase [Bacteroidales bacterium]|nr:dTMP kinase [Candidatus Cryptobacteroides aphodequi]
MLIVLEGLDGAGKSTQVRMLKDYLQRQLGNLRYIHFPRYEAPVYGDLISRFLKGDFGSLESVHPQLVALLFAEDRHGAAPEIREALERGETVLLDRYVYSNIAYQCAKLASENEAEALRHWIFDTEFGRFGEPRPDLNIFLDVPIGFVENNLNSARLGADRNYLQGASDIHEANIAFQRRVRDMYLRQAAEDPSLTVVDCSDPEGRMLPSDKIFEKIRVLVDTALSK